MSDATDEKGSRETKAGQGSGHESPRQKGRLGVALPFIVFAALAGLFFAALHFGDPSRLPSALIGKPAPAFDLPPLPDAASAGGDQANVTSALLGKGTPAIVHFFASWCAPCREEHPTIMALADKLRAENPDVPFYGINYKDDATAARRFLAGYGDPYTFIGVDSAGRTAIDFGVYGVPEIYVIASDGTVAFRQAGPLTDEVLQAKILPLLKSQPKANGPAPANAGSKVRSSSSP
ncbi:MAG: DsbE family thiol:disulfide interchange protein [Pseudomonadota bacterium]